jgi:hypothetical protein
MSEWHFIPWTSQYLIGLVVAVVTTISLLRREKDGKSQWNILALGIPVALWMIFIFLHRNAPDASMSAIFLKGSFPATWTFLASLSLIVISLRGFRRWHLLVFIPAIFESILLFFRLPLDFFWTAHGWSYFADISQILNLQSIVVFYLYIIATTFVAAVMIKKVKHLRRAYTIFFGGIVAFQGVGLISTNLLIIADPNFPPFGGILTAATFITAAVALNEKRRVVLKARGAIPHGLERVAASLEALLHNLVASLPSQGLGQDWVRFARYLDEAGLDAIVYPEKSSYLLDSRGLSKANLIQVVEKSFELIDSEKWARRSIDYVGSLTNEVKDLLKKEDREGSEIFTRRLGQAHEDLFEHTDLAYQIDPEILLNLTKTTDEEQPSEDWDTALSIHRRILLAVSRELDLHAELRSFRNAVRSGGIPSLMDTTELGIVSLERVRKHLKDLPASQRLSQVLDDFAEFLRWLYSQVLMEDRLKGQLLARRLELVLTKNKSKAFGIGLAQTLFNALPKDNLIQAVRKNLLGDLATATVLDPFSSDLNLTHGQLMARFILLQFDPQAQYENLVLAFVLESTAAGEEAVVFTRARSNTARVVLSRSNARVGYLDADARQSGSISPRESVIPLSDEVWLIDSINSFMMNKPALAMVFDDLSDLSMWIGSSNTYRFVRQLLKLLSHQRAPALFLLNRRAHGEQEKSSLEPLFNIIITADEKKMTLIKGPS